MKAIVAITAYDRIDLLERCLISLSNNDQSLFHVCVYPDMVSDAVYNEIESVCVSVCKSSGMFIRLFSRPDKRLYCCRNILHSLETSSSLEPEFIIKLDGDLLVAKDFVKVMLSFSQACNGGFVTSSIICPMPFREKCRLSGNAVYGSLSGSNFAVSKTWWDKIAGTADPLIRKMQPIDGSAPDHNKDWAHLKTIATASNPTNPGAKLGRKYFLSDEMNTGSDAIIVLGAAVCDCPISSLVVNRVIHPSPIGAHTTPEFHAAHYANTFLDEIPGDDTRTEFAWQ